MRILGAATGLILSTMLFAQDVNTATTGWLNIPKCGGECTIERCKGDGGCAECVAFRVYLPLGANIKAIRYYTDTNEGGVAQVQPETDLQWAKFTGAKTYSTASNVVHEVTFQNRRTDHGKRGKVDVDWTSPQ